MDDCGVCGGRLHIEGTHPLQGKLCFPAAVNHTTTGDGGEIADGDVLAGRQIEEESALLAVFGKQRDPEGACRRWRVDRNALSGDREGSGVRQSAVESGKNLTSARSEKASEPQDLAGLDTEGDAVKRASDAEAPGRAQILGFEQWRAGWRSHAIRVERTRLLPRHALDEDVC